MIVKNNKLKL